MTVPFKICTYFALAIYGILLELTYFIGVFVLSARRDSNPPPKLFGNAYI